MRKTVVELDLVGYSTVARLLEEAAGPQSVAALNDQIQKFIDQGLQVVELPRQKTVIKTTGDGAILVFGLAWRKPTRGLLNEEAFHEHISPFQ